MAYLTLATVAAGLGATAAFILLRRTPGVHSKQQPHLADFDSLRIINTKSSSQQTLTLPDGRELGFASYGAETGPTIFLLHGFGDCRLTGAFYEDAGKKLGVRIVGIDRPGVGLSSPQKHRTALDHAEDVRQLAAHLDAKTYSVLGVSGGGPFALACAYALPEEQLKSVSLVCCTGPFDLTMRNSPWPVWFFFQTCRAFPFLLRWFRTSELKQNEGKPVDEFVARTRKQLDSWLIHILGPHEKDLALFRDDGFLAFVCDVMREHYKQGVDPHMDELRLLTTSDLGFKLEEVRPDLPVYLWYGRYDSSVSVRVGEAIKASLGCKAQLNVRDEAHMSLALGCREEVLARALESM